MRCGRDLANAEIAILNAPFVERGWERALVAIAEATGSSSAHLLGIGGPQFLAVNMIVGPAAAFDKYINDPHLHGACNWRVQSTTAPMAIQNEEHYAFYRAANPTSDYDDVVSEMDVPFGCQCALLVHQHGFFGMSLLRSHREGRTTPELIQRFARLRLQLARAVQMQIALDGEAAELMLSEAGARESSTILLDRHGAICAASPAAETLIGASGPFRGGIANLILADAQDDALFQKALGRVYGVELASTGSLTAEVRLGKSPSRPGGRWRLVISRLPGDSTGLGFEPHAAVTVQAA